jgi:hypothetical protein
VKQVVSNARAANASRLEIISPCTEKMPLPAVNDFCRIAVFDPVLRQSRKESVQRSVDCTTAAKK